MFDSSIARGSHRKLVASETVQGDRPKFQIPRNLRPPGPSVPDFTEEIRKSMRRCGVSEFRPCHVNRQVWIRHENYVEQVLRVTGLPAQPKKLLQRLSEDPLEAINKVFSQEMCAVASNSLGFPWKRIVSPPTTLRSSRRILSTSLISSHDSGSYDKNLPAAIRIRFVDTSFNE